MFKVGAEAGFGFFTILSPWTTALYVLLFLVSFALLVVPVKEIRTFLGIFFFLLSLTILVVHHVWQCAYRFSRTRFYYSSALPKNKKFLVGHDKLSVISSLLTHNRTIIVILGKANPPENSEFVVPQYLDSSQWIDSKTQAKNAPSCGPHTCFVFIPDSGKTVLDIYSIYPNAGFYDGDLASLCGCANKHGFFSVNTKTSLEIAFPTDDINKLFRFFYKNDVFNVIHPHRNPKLVFVFDSNFETNYKQYKKSKWIINLEDLAKCKNSA